MSITLFTSATGFPDLEVKIAFGPAKKGIEAIEVKTRSFILKEIYKSKET